MPERLTVDTLFTLLSDYSCRAVNGGNYVMLPTPGSIAMFERWSVTAHDAIKENQNDQQFLGRIRDTTIRVCTNRWGCNNVRNEVRGHRECLRVGRHGGVRLCGMCWGPHVCGASTLAALGDECAV